MSDTNVIKLQEGKKDTISTIEIERDQIAREIQEKIYSALPSEKCRTIITELTNILGTPILDKRHKNSLTHFETEDDGEIKSSSGRYGTDIREKNRDGKNISSRHEDRRYEIIPRDSVLRPVLSILNSNEISLGDLLIHSYNGNRNVLTDSLCGKYGDRIRDEIRLIFEKKIGNEDMAELLFGYTGRFDFADFETKKIISVPHEAKKTNIGDIDRLVKFLNSKLQEKSQNSEIKK